MIGETSIIIEHVGGARLVPSLQARLWDRICDQYVSDAVQAIVFDTIEQRFDERAVQQARQRLEMAYGMLEAQLGAREFLAGDTLTIADCAAAPGLFLADRLRPLSLSRRGRLPSWLTQPVHEQGGNDPDHEDPGQDQERVQEWALVAEL
jgi:glutathione S-transferase